MGKLFVISAVFMFALLLSTGAAMANGTITATILYNGQPLQGAYLYLNHSATWEMYFQSGSIYGPSNSNGIISASVPEGTYYVRITKRGTSSPWSTYLGPPNAGDYDWVETDPPTITLTTSGTVNLGTVNTALYAQHSTISGAITFPGMKPAADVFVKATTVQCTQSNQCGPNVYPAWTDSNGNYTITVPPGTYYVYATKNAGPLTYSEVPGGAPYNGPVTVTSGQNLTGINISGQIH